MRWSNVDPGLCSVCFTFLVLVLNSSRWVQEHAAEADGGALRANLCAVGAVSLAERN